MVDWGAEFPNPAAPTPPCASCIFERDQKSFKNNSFLPKSRLHRNRLQSESGAVRSHPYSPSPLLPLFVRVSYHSQLRSPAPADPAPALFSFLFMDDNSPSAESHRGACFQDHASGSRSGSSEAPPHMGDGRLWIKLKIPKSRELEGEESMRERRSALEKEIEKEKEESVRICSVCNKGFSSGKALGGHMRIHYQTHKQDAVKNIHIPKLTKQVDTSAQRTPMSCAIPLCSLCGKIFPSMKSLFGHMRCHPERQWRGIQPPPTARNSSSSTLSDAFPQKSTADDHVDSAANIVASVFDLSQSLWGWSVTEKRGRQGRSAASAPPFDDHIPDGVYDLMMLARGHYHESRTIAEDSDATNSNSLTNYKVEIKEESNQLSRSIFFKKNRIRNGVVVGVGCGTGEYRKSKKLRIEEGLNNGKGKAVLVTDESVREELAWEYSDEESESVDTEGSVPTQELNLNGCGIEEKMRDNKKLKKTKKKTKTKKKGRRKMKWRDLEAVGDVGTWVDEGDRYKCSTCNKTFPTHQALGGHCRSRRNIPKNAPTTGGDGSAELDDQAAHGVARNVEQLNATEECEDAADSKPRLITHLCSETFPTGPTRGIQKMCRAGSPGDRSRLTLNQTETGPSSRKMLDFDLNELPAPEDE